MARPSTAPRPLGLRPSPPLPASGERVFASLSCSPLRICRGPVPRLAQPSEPRRHLGDSLLVRHRSGKPFLRRLGEDRAADGEALHGRALRREPQRPRRARPPAPRGRAARRRGSTGRRPRDRVLDRAPGRRRSVCGSSFHQSGLTPSGIEPLEHVGGGRRPPRSPCFDGDDLDQKLAPGRAAGVVAPRRAPPPGAPSAPADRRDGRSTGISRCARAAIRRDASRGPASRRRAGASPASRPAARSRTRARPPRTAPRGHRCRRGACRPGRFEAPRRSPGRTSA